MASLSDLKDLLWFENISPYSEPIFPLLGFGMLSIKQLGILGFAIMFAWGIWQKGGDYLAIIPVIVALMLVIKRQNVISIEIMVIRIFLFHTRKQNDLKLKKVSLRPAKKTPPHNPHPKLLIANQYHIRSNVDQNSISKSVNIRNIPYIYDKMFRMKIRLNNNGQTPTDTHVRIVLDDILYGTTRPDSNGEIVFNFIPERVGKIFLQVYDKSVNPIHEEILNFVKA